MKQFSTKAGFPAIGEFPGHLCIREFPDTCIREYVLFSNKRTPTVPVLAAMGANVVQLPLPRRQQPSLDLQLQGPPVEGQLTAAGGITKYTKVWTRYSHMCEGEKDVD